MFFYRFSVSADGAFFTVTTGILKDHKLITKIDTGYKAVKRFLDCPVLFKSLKEYAKLANALKPSPLLFANTGYIAASKDRVYFVFSLYNEVKEFSHEGALVAVHTLPLPSIDKTARMFRFSDGSMDLENQLNYDIKVRNGILYVLSRDEKGNSILFQLQKGKLIEKCRMEEELSMFDINSSGNTLYGIDKEESAILVYEL